MDPVLHAPNVARIAPPAPLALRALTLRLVRLPLLEPFETSLGTMDSRLLFLVELEAAGESGWGEVVAWERPLYSYETVETARHVIRDFLAPALFEGPISGLGELAARFARFRGHPMARAGLELAFADLVARLRREPLAALLGGTRQKVAVGVSLGIQARLPLLLERVERFLALGYRRIKLKIKPGWDVAVVSEVRRRHPEIALSADANAAYVLADADRLRPLDALRLLMIEQPLAHDDLVDHAALQRQLETPLCLDESVTGLERARQALEIGACRIVNMKVGRVGGYSQALAIHELCLARGAPLWCGGMLESGIGRAHNVALASLPGFSLPGDISASRRYFARDIIEPEVEVDAEGMIAVPAAPGTGFEVDRAFLEARTEALERLCPPA
jgi:O-succinylbenzoate synthase